jgi:hypothetical protein
MSKQGGGDAAEFAEGRFLSSKSARSWASYPHPTAPVSHSRIRNVSSMHVQLQSTFSSLAYLVVVKSKSSMS